MAISGFMNKARTLVNLVVRGLIGYKECRKINVYCGFLRATVVKTIPEIINDFVFQIPCIECNGSGIFDCGIKEEKGICVRCKGTGKEFIGL